MDSNIIKFRLSQEFMNLLENSRQEGESLHQVAKRLLEGTLKGTHSPDTVHQAVAELESYFYAKFAKQVNAMVDARLGK